MFDVPFLYGQAWSEADDARGADVVVLSRALAEKLFGDANPVGQRMTHDWASNTRSSACSTPGTPLPRYYRLIGSKAHSARSEEFFIPFASAIRHETGTQRQHELQRRRATRLPGPAGLRTAPGSSSGSRPGRAAERAELQAYLDSYASEQRKLGRMKRARAKQAVRRDGVDGPPARSSTTTASCRPGWRSASCCCAWSTRSACCWRSSRCAPPKSASAARWAPRAATSSASS